MEADRSTSARLCADRFELERVAGSGGMGTVYRARDVYDGRIVALKLLNSTSPEVGARFKREAQILAELRHPNIVEYVAHGQTITGEPFLAMEWLEGEDLGRRLQRGPLSIQESVSLLGCVAEALCVAHARGVIHRDLKPTNLFLCDNDVKRVKILDFGIARRSGATFALTQAGAIMGTPQYMAPEQARAAQNITPAVDMFSLGCVLYECLAGEPPFVATQIAALLGRILFEDPMPIEMRRPTVMPGLKNLVNQLLHKDLSQRIPDALALREVLSSLEDGHESTLHLDATLPEPIKKSENFADHERRLFSIVLANPPYHAIPDGEGLRFPGGEPNSHMLDEALDATQLADSERQSLLDALVRLGTAPDFLSNGSLIVTVPSAGLAQDQVVRAARAALLIKDQWPSAVISLATGRGVLQGRSAAGEVVERAAHALTPNPELTTSGIHIDTLSAKLLEGRFAITSRSFGAMLHDEHRSVDESRLLLGKPTACVGREVELDNLEGLLEICIEEKEAKAIIVTAKAGLGKSRLRHEFLRRVDKRDESIMVLVGRGSMLHVGAAYRMVVRAIHAACKITGAESITEQRKLLRDRIELHLAPNDKPRIVPLLGEMCGIRFSEEEYPIVKELHQHPNSLPEQLRWALISWLGAECRVAPVVFVLDDLHWGDALTVGAIDDALRTLRDTPFYVLALARPEVHSAFPSLWKMHRPESIALRTLSKRACTRLVEQALGRTVDPETLQWIVHQSGGNALFLEELIRAVADGHSKEQPETVVAMLQARIGHLDTRMRHTLLAASILGSTFWDLGVAAVLGISEQTPEINRWLDKAVDSEFIELRSTSRVVGQREFAFRHALIHDAAYGLLSEQDRRLGHQRAAEYLESQSGVNCPRALLGYHYCAAGQFERAFDEYLKAGNIAASLFLDYEAVVHYQHGEEAAQRLPAEAKWLRERANLILRQVQCSRLSVPPALTWQRIARARVLLETIEQAGHGEAPDRLLRAKLDYEAGQLHIYFDQYAEASACFERALHIAEEFHDQQLLTVVRGMYGRKLFLEGNVTHAIQLLEPLLAQDPNSVDLNVDTARAYTYLALVLAQNGRARAAQAHIARVRAWIDDLGQSVSLWFLYSNIAATYLYAHDFEAALQCCRAGANYELNDSRWVSAYITVDVVAWVHCYREEFDDALRNRLHAVELRGRHGSNLQKELFEAIHARILLGLGKNDAALELAMTATQSARERGSILAVINGERAWGLALAAMGQNAEEVDEHLAASLALANKVGSVIEAMQTEIAWGKVHLDRHEGLKARACFGRVRDRLTEAMMPSTHDYYLRIINSHLQRCDVLMRDVSPIDGDQGSNDGLSKLHERV
jgi:serine/threonine protein kinase/tetratricopeptide (TPR) repeat protein